MPRIIKVTLNRDWEPFVWYNPFTWFKARLPVECDEDTGEDMDEDCVSIELDDGYCYHFDADKIEDLAAISEGF